MNYRLSPSDLTFLYDGCKRCFVLKVKHGIAQPSIPIPAIFSTIGSLQKEYYSGKRTETFCEALPPGIVKKLARGKPLPPGIAKRSLPQDLVVELPERDGFEITIFGDRVVLLEASGLVVDILTGIFD